MEPSPPAASPSPPPPPDGLEAPGAPPLFTPLAAEYNNLRGPAVLFATGEKLLPPPPPCGDSPDAEGEDVDVPAPAPPRTISPGVAVLLKPPVAPNLPSPGDIIEDEDGPVRL